MFWKCAHVYSATLFTLGVAGFIACVIAGEAEALAYFGICVTAAAAMCVLSSKELRS